jgi:hypothetical protein
MPAMKTDDVADYFGSEYKAAKALQIHQSYITRWKSKVPELWARRLHDITNGVLRFDSNEYPYVKRIRRTHK